MSFDLYRKYQEPPVRDYAMPEKPLHHSTTTADKAAHDPHLG